MHGAELPLQGSSWLMILAAGCHPALLLPRCTSTTRQTFRTTVSEDDPAFNTYLRDPTALRAFIVDSNAVCQEKGVEACCAFVEFGGKNAASKAKEQLMQAIVEKNVFGVARAGTKKALVELCLLLVECAEDAGEGVLVPLATDGIKSKQPKAVAGAVNAMKEVVKWVYSVRGLSSLASAVADCAPTPHATCRVADSSASKQPTQSPYSKPSLQYLHMQTRRSAQKGPRSSRSCTAGSVAHSTRTWPT